MIYFIDEDENELRSFAVELKLRGYDTKQLLNADEAFDVLITVDDVELAILDIMLSTGEGKTSRYSREKTQDFIKTGLILLDDLVSQKPDVFPKRVVIFSHARAESLVGLIRAAASDYHIPYLDKNDYDNSYDFGNKVQNILNQLTT